MSNKIKQFTSNSEKETHGFAKKYVQGLKGGEVILLQGNLGAGKSVFVRGLADGLGVKEPITSPTFTLMQLYDVRKKSKGDRLVHVDAYRVEWKDLQSIGLEDYLNEPSSIVVIEWGEKVEKALAKLKIGFQTVQIKLKDTNKREIIVVK